MSRSIPIAQMIIEYLIHRSPRWMLESAECRDAEDIDFLLVADFERAKREFCDRCVVREQCLEYGIVTQNEEGFWGGEDIYDYTHPDYINPDKAREMGLEEGS